jgi:acetylornithine deacetylase
MSRVEDRIVAAVDRDRAVALEQAMVRIPSFTLKEQALALYLYRYMKSIGLEVELQAVPINDESAGVQPIGRLRGAGGGTSLMLSGHMDFTGLEEPTGWRHPPFSAILEDGYIYGRGAKDEKGGICASLTAVEALMKSGVRLKGDLVIAPVMAQLPAGRSLGVRGLIESGVTADMIIVTENSNLSLCTVLVGRVSMKLHLEGVPGSFEGPGTDLYGRLARLIGVLGENYATIPPKQWLRYEPHRAYAGFPMVHYRAIDMSSRGCTVTMNVRTVPGQTEESVRTDIERVLASLKDSDPHYRFRVEVLDPVHYPYSISEGDPLVRAIANAHKKIRSTAPATGLASRRGAVDDGWFFVERGHKHTTVYGPGIQGRDFPDAPDERISVADMIDAAKVYALTAIEICGVA